VTFTGGFHGDVFLLLKLLLPGVIKAVYNLQDKQLVKCFSTIFDTDLDEMIEDLEQGDVAETVALFFDKSNNVKPQKKSTLSLHEVMVAIDKRVGACNKKLAHLTIVERGTQLINLQLTAIYHPFHHITADRQTRVTTAMCHGCTLHVYCTYS